MKKILSIIIPTYNMESLLTQCLNSLLVSKNLDMLENIKQLRDKARKDKDTATVETLNFLLGEIDRKVSGAKNIENLNTVIINIIKKLIESNLILLSVKQDSNLVLQNNLLLSFLPELYSEDKIKQIIFDFIQSNENVQLKQIMVYLNSEHSGKFDSKSVIPIIKGLLT